MKILNTIYDTLFGYEPYKPLRYLLMALLSLIVTFILFAFDMFIETHNDPINIYDIIFDGSVGIIFFALLIIRDRMISKTNYVTKAFYYDKVMTIHYNNGETEEYNGSCTVWYKMPNMKRCSTLKEEWLCGIYKCIEYYGNPYNPETESVDEIDYNLN